MRSTSAARPTKLDSPAGAGRGERRAQHRHPGLGQLGAGVDAQLLGQQRDRAVERGEGVGLAARGVQCPAEQCRRGLAQRRGGELGGERVDVGRETQPQRQRARSSTASRGAPPAGRGRAREGQFDDVGQRGPAPERQRVAEQAVRLRRARRPRLGEQPVELQRVDRARLDGQPVAAGLGDHELARHRPAQPRHQRLQGVGRVLRRGLPQPVDERGGADGAPGVEREPGQQPAQAHAGQAARPVDGAQHADPHGHQCAAG
jgi:hypothetical protein